MRAGPWIAVLEAFLVKKLLQSAAFHRAIGKAHKSVHRLRHGIPPEEMGGTKLDTPAGQGWLSHFVDELKDQAFAKKTQNTARPPPQQQPRPQPRRQEPPASRGNADGADHSSQSQGFVSNFMDEIKQQFRSGNGNR